VQKETIFYTIISISALVFVISFLFSQYLEYKKYILSKESAIEECVEKTVGANSTGFISANAYQKCKDKFSR